MGSKRVIARVGRIEERILMIRGEKVIIDADLAEFYGVATKRLNEQVRRNADRFPNDFMIELNPTPTVRSSSPNGMVAGSWDSRR